MTASTDFLPFATGSSANVEAQSSWVSDATVTNGFSSGIATSAKFNKALRQGTFVAAGLANWMAQELSANIADDGNVSGFVTNLSGAISAYVGTLGYAASSRIGNFLTSLSYNANVTLTASQAGSAVQLYGSSSFTVTLPTATSCTNGAEFEFVNNASMAVTIARQSSDTMFIGTTSGLTSVVLQPGNTLHIYAIPSSNTWVSVGGSLQLLYDTPSTTTPTAGDNSQRIATTAYVQANTFSAQQSWQNVTASRVSGTTYTNTTGRPIHVLVVLPDTANGSPTVTVVVGGVTIINALVYDAGTSAGTAIPSFIVPPGATYSLTLGGTLGTIASWSELR